MSETRLDLKTTEANYDRWHRWLEGPTMKTSDPRQGVLVPEILGDTDGPHETDQD